MRSSQVLEFTDPDRHQAAASRVENLSIVITAPGKFRSEIASVELHNLSMDQGRMSLPRIIRGTPKLGSCRFHFPTFDNQAPATFNGIETPAPSIAFSNPGAEFIASVPAENRWGRINLPSEKLASASRVLTGREIAPPKRMDFLRPAPALMARLQNVHLAAMRLAATAPQILAHDEVAKAIEQELLRALVDCIVNPDTIEKARPNRQRIVQRFHEAVEARQSDTVYLAEICAEIGVSDRTLRSVCKEYLGVNPHRYLWLRRMNHVRRALIHANPKASTVTTIANNHGFGELGRFATEYRKLYGESPSVTLRR
jgi:AraC-like DNA-binding protein